MEKTTCVTNCDNCPLLSSQSKSSGDYYWCNGKLPDGKRLLVRSPNTPFPEEPPKECPLRFYKLIIFTLSRQVER